MWFVFSKIREAEQEGDAGQRREGNNRGHAGRGMC